MRLVLIVPHNSIQNCITGSKYRNLGQIADVKISAAHYRAIVWLLQSGHNFQKGRLSGTVDADEAHLLALIDAERCIIKQQALSIRFCQMFDCN